MPDQAPIVVGVCGGIAAYKTAQLVSQLVQRGQAVRVVMTAAAHEFVGPATFRALTGSDPISAPYDPRYPLGPHIELARHCRLFVVAPATANFLAKAAAGLADDLLSTLYLCQTCPVLICPAMNVEMWQHPAVQRNVAQLQQDGVQFVGPEAGWLSCRTEGLGRMAEPDTIREAIETRLKSRM